ncbi:hypothetical protein SARC_12294 [Sphaeroforma arctica JP610]|uniref:Uncharacterized protein n=1 Tax=Sphaeroforma arctica JP610 TaxID=667725 RepID=A0A0L0FGK7_9EUKA|nr:hypothetical protein SARC_12294 [Sphaeroforma arctica JP610]KNC75173.1 hypothetical protein SARC_12294 [Sphaeroforma arctica JP610]|eukprot:XP_014149075.1 hypothetical protein SARC_12294 [Sphaeroforma arctica JP610]
MSCMLSEEDRGSLWNEQLITTATQPEARIHMLVIDSTPKNDREIFRVVYHMGGIAKAAEVLRGMIASKHKAVSRPVVVVRALQPSVAVGGRSAPPPKQQATPNAGFTGCHECGSMEHKKYQCSMWKEKRVARRKTARENGARRGGQPIRRAVWTYAPNPVANGLVSTPGTTMAGPDPVAAHAPITGPHSAADTGQSATMTQPFGHMVMNHTAGNQVVGALHQPVWDHQQKGSNTRASGH